MSASYELIDTHAHLDMTRFESDLDDVVGRALESRVTRIVCMGIDLPSSRRAVQLTEQYSFLYTAIGIHPEEARHTTKQDIEDLAVLANNRRVIAIGEIGLDFYRDYGPREKQAEVFGWQLDLASRLNLPVTIHAREADRELIALLDAWPGRPSMKPPGVIHCFNSSLENAQAYIDMGFYISLGGYIGYPSAKSVREVITQLPLEKLLLETDCPFLPPQSHRGERNEPAYLIETATELARLKNVSVAELAYVTTTNAKLVFGRLDD